MTKEEIQNKRTEIISSMLDNPNKIGIYPTTKCFEKLDKLIQELQREAFEAGRELIGAALPHTFTYDRFEDYLKSLENDNRT